MTYDEVFEAYYTLYRAEAQTPDSTDDEYTIGMRLANEAIKRWASYDATYWKELFTTAQTNSTGGVVTISTGVSSYAAPTSMQEAGGYISISNASTGVIQARYPILDPQEVQFRDQASRFAYFTGNPGTGFTLHLNTTPDATYNGMLINYVYYKKPTLFTTGTDVTEMSDPYFIVHRVLANRFRASRNPYYNSAKQDAENALGQMKMDNDSGNWSNTPALTDNSGTVWGASSGSGAPW